ncbi:hypothetical protein FUMI01_09910 [Flavobacterium sp. UMI-01]|nr:hypothetical protein FUMI01_09910 [Flavobacterium sp. UMI-01]
MKDSVGKTVWSTGFTKFLLFSSSAFFARILANEKAETLGPSKLGVSFFVEAKLFSGAVAEIVLVFAWTSAVTTVLFVSVVVV